MARATQPTPEPEGDNDDAVDATAEEVTSTELVAASSHGIIRAERPEEIIEKAIAIANPLKDLIEKQNLSVHVGGKKKHVEVGAWQALGTLLGAMGGESLHAETVWSRPARDADGDVIRHAYTAEVKRYHKKDQGGGLRETITYEVDGHDWEARVEIKTLSGLVVGSAEALCSRSEETWNQRSDPACKSMAETRAESRAYRRAVGWIVNIAGYNPTPAEEMPEQKDEDAGPPFGPPAAADSVESVLRALAFLADIGKGPSVEVAARVEEKVMADAGGYFPKIVARAFLWLGAEVKQLVDAESAGGGEGQAAEQAQAQSGEPDQQAEDPAAPEGEASVEEVDGEIVPEGGD